MNSQYIKHLGPDTKCYVDTMGAIRNPPAVFVVDGNNNPIASSLPRPTPPSRIHKIPIDKMKATKDDLLDLKEAMINDTNISYLKQLNQATSLVTMAWSPDRTDQEFHALRWCWNVLLWRPSKDKSRVIKKHPNNPYRK